MVTVVIPAYNAAGCIDECIKSVCNQTFSSWRLLVVNDGSSDDTEKKLAKWAEIDFRIKFITQTNAGVSAARNKALSLIDTPYVLMLDADDTLEQHAVEKLVECMQSDESIDLVTSGFCEVYKSSNQRISRGGLLMGRKDEGVFSVQDGFLAEYLHCSIWGKLMKMEIIRKHGINFNADLRVGEDHLFSLQYLLHCRKVFVLQEELYNYMQWNSSAITSFDSGRLPFDCYIMAVTIYSEFSCTLPPPLRKSWSTALLSHYLRMRKWVKRIFNEYRAKEWKLLRKRIDRDAFKLFWRVGIVNSLRMIRRWI